MNDMYSEKSLEAIALDAKRKLEKDNFNYKVKEEGISGINLDNVDYSKSIDVDDLYTVDTQEDDFDVQSVNEIFTGGPSEATIGLWKKTYPDCLVFVSEISGELFVARSITRLEYKKLISLPIDQLQREEVICSTCVLFPYNIDWQEINGLRAGIPSTLATVIMENSGFSQDYGVQIL